MKLILYSIFFILLSIGGQAQETNQEIKNIQTFIQETSQNEWFDPINKMDKLDNGVSYDIAYYVLTNKEVFSIIYTVFDKTTLRKSFYYKQNQLIACIVEETDANNANKILKYADYFIKDNELINKLEEKSYFPSKDIITEGIEKLNAFNN